MDRSTKINKITAYGLFLLALNLLMSQFGYRMEIYGVQPVLSVFAIAAIAMFEGASAGVAAGFMLGFMFDSMTSHYLGFHILMYMLTGYLCGYLCIRYFRKKLATVMLLGLASSLLVSLLKFMFVYLIFDRAPFSALWTVVLPEVGYSVLFTPILYLVVRLIYLKTSPSDDFAL